MKYFYFLFLLCALSAKAQVSPQWAARFDGAGDFDDKVNAMAVDPSSNRYLAGYSMRPGNEKDFLVMKIDANGDTLWTRTFDGPNHGSDEALDIAYDATGFVYVTGYVEGVNTGNDFFIVKLNLQGDTSWTRTYNNVTNQDEQGSALATDGAGNVVAVGYTDLDPAPLTTNQDYLIIRYTPSGTQTYLATYNGFNNTNDYATDVIFQSNGNSVVTGKAKNSDDDFVTRCYSPTGSLVWMKVMDGGGGKDRAHEMVQDNAGNIIVVGECNNGNDYDYGVVKYNSSGTELWRNFYDHGAGNDYPLGVAVDASGNIFLTGKCDVDPLLPVVNDLVTVAYNSTGTQQWATPFNGTGNGNDEGDDIATDPSGNVFVTGKTDMDPVTTNSDYDMVVIKYNASGNQQWQDIQGNTYDDDGGTVVMTDASGNCIAAGNIRAVATMKDIHYLKYTPSGNITWSKSFGGPGDHSDVVNAMTTDASGNSYMCGSTYSPANKSDMCVVKVDAIGDTVWTRTIDGTYNSTDAATAIAVDGSGNVYITGYVKDTANGYNYCTAKYSSSGTLLWLTKYNYALGNGTDKATAMKINSAGEVFVTGESDSDPSSANNKDFATVKYSATGAQLWVMRYAGSGNLNDKPYAMSLNAAGEIVVAGKIAISATDDDAVVVKYSSSGAQLWAFVYSNSLGNDAAVAIDQDMSGNVGLAMRRTNANGNYDIAFAHLTSGGTDLGYAAFNGTGNGNDVPSSVMFDNSGNAYLVGQTDVDTTVGLANYDMVTLKYNTNGTFQWAKTYAGTAGDDDNGVELVIDNSTGYVYATGQVQNGTLFVKNNDIVTLQYDPAGNQQLIGTYDAASLSDGPSGISLQGNNLFVSGTSTGANNHQKDMVMLLYTTYQVNVPTIENNSSISVYPNPCSSFTEIHFENASQRNISLVDVNGRVVFNHNSNEQMTRIETNEFAKGVYFGTVIEEGKIIQHFKIIVE